MKTRILAGLALVPLLLLVILGGLHLYIGEFIIISIAINEFYKAFKVKQINPIFSLGYIFAFYLYKKLFRFKNELHLYSDVYFIYMFYYTYVTM